LQFSAANRTELPDAAEQNTHVRAQTIHCVS
jgi:hypothetical protein